MKLTTHSKFFYKLIIVSIFMLFPFMASAKIFYCPKMTDIPLTYNKSTSEWDSPPSLPYKGLNFIDGHFLHVKDPKHPRFLFHDLTFDQDGPNGKLFVECNYGDFGSPSGGNGLIFAYLPSDHCRSTNGVFCSGDTERCSITCP